MSLTEVPASQTGCLVVDDVVAACSSDTRLVSVMLANNETGVLFDVPQIARAVKRAFPGVLVHTDAAQAIGKWNIIGLNTGLDGVGSLSLGR